ncbi:MAG: T9SS type A sorting domain-containing protein, partial [Saprospiraceae bacterium]|nr:T9SS type A sorting domain-containing protein [Saprospiraceae bacterium]
YVPGVSGSELGNGSTTGTSAAILGLEGLLTYSFWVRSDCGDGFSTWTGPLNFTTDPSCGDPFSDTGGPFGEYDVDEDYIKVFCPDIPDNAVSMDFFLPFSFSSTPGDTLKVYNGNNTGFPLLDALSGGYSVPPGPYTATTAGGCLTVHFTSDEVKAPEDMGWVAFLVCLPLPADECYEVLELDTSAVSYNTATLSWLDMFGADTYEYELLELPDLDPVEKDLAYNGNQIVFDNLESGTAYRFSVRTNCANDEHSDWVTFDFNTPVKCTGPFITCNLPTSVSASQTGLWDISDCNVSNPGKERVFQFVASNTKSYQFEVTAANGGYVSYFYKAASEGCNDENWHCIDDFNVPGASSLPAIPGSTLTAGQLYYILCDPQTTGAVSQTFKIYDCTPPPNDLPVNAVDLTVNTPCDDNVYSNLGAGLDPGEPDPDVEDDGLIGRWLDAADETVWFKFSAPPTGTVTIFTDPKSALIPNDDTQVALYQVGDPADYATYQLLVSDEDNGNTYLGYNSVVSYTGLNPGGVYYIQVDGYGVNSGAFCIAVIETVEAVTQANCDADYTLANVSGDQWFGIYATPDDLDIGPLAAAINPNDYDLGTVTCRVQTYDDSPVSANGIPYMPVYYYFTSSLVPAGEVKLRLYYTNSDFADLKTAANEPDNTIQDLVISRFNGAVADCEQVNNTGPSTLLSVDNAVQMVGTFYLEFYTAQLGEFGAHFGQVPLPLELVFFSGKVSDQENLLQWKTLREKNVQWHIVERSPDGVNWSETGRMAGQINSTTPQNYELADKKPLAKAYYRLRSVDFDGTASVSQAVLLTRSSGQSGITGVFPSPTTDRLTVQFASLSEEPVVVRLTDFNGHVVLEQTAQAGKGIISSQLSLRDLPAGVYNVTVAGETSVSEPVRVVKQ